MDRDFITHLNKIYNNIVIVPEGVVTISDTTFTGSQIKKIFLPSTLLEVSDVFWDSLKEIETLYYGGTKEQLEKIIPCEVWQLGIKDIQFEVLETDVVTQ